MIESRLGFNAPLVRALHRSLMPRRETLRSCTCDCPGGGFCAVGGRESISHDIPAMFCSLNIGISILNAISRLAKGFLTNMVVT